MRMPHPADVPCASCLADEGEPCLTTTADGLQRTFGISHAIRAQMADQARRNAAADIPQKEHPR